ncbi:hypothetical protein [Paenilisteria rocourtiae]|uniref:Uncharacterized protein n=1 Tax=Listeria rocourtiae TaxID=647910 RepID=A0A4R6ZN78_9LIST|nr:hypothetical protein [Listeria rocourtiae]EUJ42569.1 hypothetical protein PROCOU_16989 [Listeria rocourtiae FSL F6-920]TDR53940.1 hypothetical protein DFP96_10334 [Listeria rocourtiae]
MYLNDSERRKLFDAIASANKEAKAKGYSLEKRKEMAVELIEANGIQLGDPLMDKLADFVLLDDLSNRDALKARVPDSFLSERQLERRRAREVAFKEFD